MNRRDVAGSYLEHLTGHRLERTRSRECKVFARCLGPGATDLVIPAAKALTAANG